MEKAERYIFQAREIARVGDGENAHNKRIRENRQLALVRQRVARPRLLSKFSLNFQLFLYKYFNVMIHLGDSRAAC